MTLAGRQKEQVPARSAALFWRFWGASTVSNIGDAVTTVALPLAALKVLGASSFQVSLLTAARYAAWIVIGLPAGAIVHRLPLRGTQVSMDLVRAAALATIPLAAWTGVLGMPQLIGVALVIGLASVVFDVGNSTFLPSIVSKEQLTARNSLISGSYSASQLGGPSLGGLLVQLFGAVTALVADFFSYLVSAAVLRGMPRAPSPAPPGRSTRMADLIKDGCRYVARHPVIGPCVLAATLINFVCGAMLALVPIFLVRTLGAPAGLVGVLMAAEAVGSVAGSVITPKLTAKLGTTRAILAATFSGAGLALLMPVATAGKGLAWFAVGYAGFAAGVVVLSIVTRTHRQTVTPPEMLSRVMATVRFISWGAVPFGALAAGATATALGNAQAMWLTCALAFLAPLALTASPVRRLRDLTDAPAPGETGGEGNRADSSVQ